MRISNNITALHALVNVSRSNVKSQNSARRLSSGIKINSAKDDSAGMVIANRMINQVKGIEMANRNSLDGISLIQTSDGALSEITNILQRIRELAVQSANGTLETDDREKIQFEIDSLVKEIDDMSNRTEFNGIKLLYGETSRIASSSNEVIANINSVSKKSMSGTLEYKLDRAGTPAKVTTNSITGGSSGVLTINNERTDILTTDTPTDIINKIKELGNKTGIHVLVDGLNVNLVTNKTGSTQEIKIDISSIDGLGSALGLATGTVKGVDAKISDVKFADDSGNINANYVNSIFTKIDGNRIEIISGTNSTFIELKTQLKSDGNFVLADGTPINNNGVIPSGSINLSVNIENHGPLILQVGQNKGMEMVVSIPKVTSHTLGLTGISLMSIESSSKAITMVDDALDKILTIRADLGAYQNRLEFTGSMLDVSSENVNTALSRIRDTDMAKEMSNYTQQSVISQAGLSILAQSNQKPQQILQLLQ